MFFPELLSSFFFYIHCVKSVRVRSFSSPYFPALGQNTEIYGVSLFIQSKSGKVPTLSPIRCILKSICFYRTYAYYSHY